MQEPPCFGSRSDAIWGDDHGRAGAEKSGHLEVPGIKTNVGVNKDTFMGSFNGITTSEDVVELDGEAKSANFHGGFVVRILDDYF